MCYNRILLILYSLNMNSIANFHNYNYFYFYDLKQRQVQESYFKMKNKYEHSFSKEEKINFINLARQDLSSCEAWQNAEIVLVPETSNQLLLELCKSKELVIIYKNDKEVIKEALDKQFFMKTEREKLYTSLDNNGSKVKMANIAGNQRKRFVEFLFKEIVLNEEQKTKNCVFLDDSIFSGYTFLAAQEAIKNINHENIILFNKNI